MMMKIRKFKRSLNIYAFTGSEELLSKTLKILFVFIITILISTSTGGCMAMKAANNEKQDLIRNISFSTNSKKILFDRRHTGESYKIHVHDLETGELAAYQSPKGETWMHARYSFDGQHIVFIKMPLIECKEDLDNAQVAIMDVDGKNIRKITNTPGLKIYPSFSHSGKKIIFARPDVIRTSGKTPAADYDAYEVDVETGRETRLTQFKFFSMSRPYYFPDDKTFVFWGDFPRAYPAIPGSDKSIDVMQKVRKDLQFKYKYNSIYVMQANAKELKPYLIMPEYQKKFKHYVADTEHSRHPSLSADGSVLIFSAQGYKSDGSADFEHLYQYSPDGNHRSVVRCGAKDIAVSHNGEFIAVIQESKINVDKIVIYQIKDGTKKEVILPDQPSRIINN